MNASRGRRSAKILFPALLATLALLAAACGGGGGGGSSKPEISDETPPVEFPVTRVTTYSGASGHEEKEKNSASDQAAEQISAQMVTLYSAGFLDPNAWRNGDYAAADDLFDGNAAKTAPQDNAVLTAGPDAGSTYSDIQPEFTHLNVKVLTDEKGAPRTAVAIAEFEATATQSAGGSTTLVSHGQYFMNKVGKDWFIFAYDVERLDGSPLTVVGEAEGPGGGKDDKKEKKDKEQTTDQASSEDEAAA